MMAPHRVAGCRCLYLRVDTYQFNDVIDVIQHIFDCGPASSVVSPTNPRNQLRRPRLLGSHSLDQLVSYVTRIRLKAVDTSVRDMNGSLEISTMSMADLWLA